MGHYITDCPIVPDPEMDLKQMPETFWMAKERVLGMLAGVGINEEISIGLKQFTGDQRCWLAMYMRDSQFRGNPIFFVNTQTPGIIDAAVLPQKITVEDVMIDSLIHEYFHVVEEWGRRKNREMYNLIYGPFSDEEDFAEYGVDFLRYHKNRSSRKTVVEKVIKLYVRDVF
ncbi:MAG: hypothetical protein E4H16_02755 [Candidatus Atribacteria bacterium]|nr:MAG: hypothetical protein E4H16_02755 [Candidatus Atribacteria bacterium]